LKKVFIIILLFSAKAFSKLSGDFVSAEVKRNTAYVKSTTRTLQLTIMNDTIVKTQFRQLNKSISDSSLSVILRNPKTEVELTESPEEVVITSSFFNIVISKKPFRVNYYRSQELLLSEKEVDTSNVLYRRRREH
jgi:hypothetical protein